MLSTHSLKKKKRVAYINKWRVVRESPKSTHRGGRKNGLLDFFTNKSILKPIFDLKHLKNILGILLNQFMTFQKCKKPT
jgi:hypothetical protein